jgi:hypothetical protein
MHFKWGLGLDGSLYSCKRAQRSAFSIAKTYFLLCASACSQQLNKENVIEEELYGNHIFYF